MCGIYCCTICNLLLITLQQYFNIVILKGEYLELYSDWCFIFYEEIRNQVLPQSRNLLTCKLEKT